MERKQMLQGTPNKTWRTDDPVDEFLEMLAGCKVILVCKEKAYFFTSSDGVYTTSAELEALEWTEEINIKVTLYTLYATSNGYKNVPIKTPDSDILFILLHFVKAAPINILLESKIKGKASLVNVTKTAGNLGQEEML